MVNFQLFCPLLVLGSQLPLILMTFSHVLQWSQPLGVLTSFPYDSLPAFMVTSRFIILWYPPLRRTLFSFYLSYTPARPHLILVAIQMCFTSSMANSDILLLFSLHSFLSPSFPLFFLSSLLRPPAYELYLPYLLRHLDLVPLLLQWPELIGSPVSLVPPMIHTSPIRLSFLFLLALLRALARIPYLVVLSSNLLCSNPY